MMFSFSTEIEIDCHLFLILLLFFVLTRGLLLYFPKDQNLTGQTRINLFPCGFCFPSADHVMILGDLSLCRVPKKDCEGA